MRNLEIHSSACLSPRMQLSDWHRLGCLMSWGFAIDDAVGDRGGPRKKRRALGRIWRVRDIMAFSNFDLAMHMELCIRVMPLSPMPTMPVCLNHVPVYLLLAESVATAPLRSPQHHKKLAAIVRSCSLLYDRHRVSCKTSSATLPLNSGSCPPVLPQSQA